jgi:hypothetical protein
MGLEKYAFMTCCSEQSSRCAGLTFGRHIVFHRLHLLKELKVRINELNVKNFFLMTVRNECKCLEARAQTYLAFNALLTVCMLILWCHS